LNEPTGDSVSSFNQTSRPKCRDRSREGTSGVGRRNGRKAAAASMTDVITTLGGNNALLLKFRQGFGMRRHKLTYGTYGELS